MSAIKYLYVRFYQLMYDVGNYDITEFTSILLMTFIFWINVLSGLMLNIIIDPRSTNVFFGKYVVVCIMASIFFALYFFLVYNGKSEQLLSKYLDENRKDRIKGRIIVILYISFSLLILMTLFFFKAWQNNNR